MGGSRVYFAGISFHQKREGDQPVLWLIILLFCRWFVYVILPGILLVPEDRGSMRLHGWRRKYRSGYRQHRFPYLQRYKRYLRSKRKHCKISGNSMISLGNSAAISQGIGPGTGAAGTITAGGEDSKGFSFCIGSFGKYRVRFLGISLLFKICKGWSKRFGIGLRICWKGQCHSKNCCRCDCK